MEKTKIDRINELARKKKTVGLSEQEIVEQTKLRKEYIQEFKSSLRGQLDNMIIERPDGSKVNVKDLKKKNNI